MKAAWLFALLASLAFAGCTASEGANPNLAAPKLVLQARPDGNVTIFVHAAFGDRLYDWLSLSVDNETIANRSIAFSIEETIARHGFYFQVAAGNAREVYELRGRADLEPAEERVEVAFQDREGVWEEPESFRLPWERVLARRPAE